MISAGIIGAHSLSLRMQPVPEKSVLEQIIQVEKYYLERQQRGLSTRLAEFATGLVNARRDVEELGQEHKEFQTAFEEKIKKQREWWVNYLDDSIESVREKQDPLKEADVNLFLQFKAFGNEKMDWFDRFFEPYGLNLCELYEYSDDSTDVDGIAGEFDSKGTESEWRLNKQLQWFLRGIQLMGNAP